MGLRTERDRIEKAEQLLAATKRALASERVALEVEKQASEDNIARAESVLESGPRGGAANAATLPRTRSTHAEGTLERMNRVREQLREHLGEIHTYARQSREDLEMGRKQLQLEVEKLRQQELGLHQARDEHRLSVAAFRQQLIEWQGQVGEMKQVLLQDESRLERKQALVEQKAQEIESTNVRLSQQAVELQRREQEVTEKRGAMDRHLVDMREWYRRKLRELSGIDLPEQDGLEADKDGTTLPLPPRPQEVGSANSDEIPPGERDILSLTGDLDAGDRQLGDNLRTLELIDAETLSALLVEARRQRRSLRQLLLAGGYLTLYQMALIEAGDLDKLVLGPVRVIDRLQATPAEAIYRVFDPRRDSEAVLRVLAESEMEDAVRPDEYRQRFSAAVSLQHPHLLATLEVLEIGGRPAVLQEWLVGLPSSEWPGLAAAPGVWYRLFSQASLALQTIHAAGLPHGNLQPASFVFTAEGSLKLLGFGEPGWLQPSEEASVEPSVGADLRALGRIAAGWAELGPRRGSKTKALPDPLPALLVKLQSENPDDCFASATELLEALDVAGSTLPANATAWERFLREVRAQAGKQGIRASA